MDFRLLRYFLRVASEGSISRAAESLHMSQPPLSQAIAQLESNLGHALFIRESRGVTLTPVGAHFAQRASQLMADLDELEELTRHGFFAAEEPLRIACVPTVSWLVLPELLSAFAVRHPQVRLDLGDPPPIEVIEAVIDGSADIGLIATLSHRQLQDSYRTSLAVTRLSLMPLKICMPVELSTGSDRVSFRELHDHTWILPRRSLRIRGLPELFDEIWHTLGLTPPPVQRVRTLQTSVPLVQAGIGMSLMPATVLQTSPNGLALREPIEPIAPLEVAMFHSTQRPLSVTAERFIDLATSLYPSDDPEL